MKTPFLDEVYGQVIFDRELVFKFFTVFSLFEYALKRTGFCSVGRNGEAKADWKAFAEAIHPNFKPMPGSELAEAVKYMTVYPVMLEVRANSGLVFTQRTRQPDINDTGWLSILVRGVRNNLFHGGKFRFDEKRDPDLIKSSLVILENWAHLNPDVEYELKFAQ
jgi:hypothetical protein